MSIKIQHITKIYGQQKALHDVSAEIPANCITGLIGPNGAGKSTLMKIITGSIRQNAGEILINDQLISENPIAFKSMIGYLPEHNPLYLNMYVKEYLLFAASLYPQCNKNKKERVSEMIELTGLTNESHKSIKKLSKGYRQRVGLAQALIHDPSIIILDEPTTGLDPNQIIEIRNLIQNISKNKTIILSTHIMQEVEAICDHTIIINKGSIILNDKTENIIHNKKMEDIFRELTLS